MKIECCYWFAGSVRKTNGFRWRWTRNGRWHYWLIGG